MGFIIISIIISANDFFLLRNNSYFVEVSHIIQMSNYKTITDEIKGGYHVNVLCNFLNPGEVEWFYEDL